MNCVCGLEGNHRCIKNEERRGGQLNTGVGVRVVALRRALHRRVQPPISRALRNTSVSDLGKVACCRTGHIRCREREGGVNHGEGLAPCSKGHTHTRRDTQAAESMRTERRESERQRFGFFVPTPMVLTSFFLYDHSERPKRKKKQNAKINNKRKRTPKKKTCVSGVKKKVLG